MLYFSISLIFYHVSIEYCELFQHVPVCTVKCCTHVCQSTSLIQIFFPKVSLPHPHFKFCSQGFIFPNSHFKFYKQGFPFPIPHFNFVYRVSFSLFPILILCTGFPIHLSFILCILFQFLI